MFFDKKKLIKTLEDLPDIIEVYFKNIPNEIMDIKRSETAWSIREHLYHIAYAQEIIYQRLSRLKDEKAPVIAPYFPENESEQVLFFESIEKAFSYYRDFRQKQILLIHQLEKADFENEASHKQYIQYNIPIIINHMIFHEYWHMYRIEDLWLARDEYFS